ncbi:hypothetical protein [Streptomyces sp. CC219B]|uniref:hypothetical protein n=1 Tax=Streptomyces sp. CC219B TaxID=3044574 RepID=UPI0024A8679C|nr:hypothetical protein [Streptomyces sp. CC219B]
MWIGIIAVYYFHALHIDAPSGEVRSGPLWAAEQVDLALQYFYAFAYAITCGLAVWEGGRTRRDGVWGLAPARSRYHVAARTLAPVVAAGWTMLGLPVVMRMIETRLVPSLAALTPLLMAMGIVVAWSVIGYALGHVTPRVVSAPLSASLVFYVIAWSQTYDDPTWPRHLLGQLDTSVAFGEYFAAPAVGLPLVFAAAAALAVAAWWLPVGRRRTRRVVRAASAVVAMAVMGTCMHVANGWEPAGGPVTAGHAPATCTGSAPRVCMATTGGAVNQLERVRGEVTRSLEQLREAGVSVSVPDMVTDQLLDGRHRTPSTPATWRLPLSALAGRQDTTSAMAALRFASAMTAVRFPCRFPSSFDQAGSADWVVNHDAALLWATTVVDADKPYLSWRKGEYQVFANPGEVLAKVEKRAGYARSLPRDRQAAWFRAEQAKACRLAGGGDVS